MTEKKECKEREFTDNESKKLKKYLEEKISSYCDERNKEITKNATEYIKFYDDKEKSKKEIKDFSWVLDADKKVLKLGRNSKDVNSIKWGIPNMVIGNPESADFYLCLLNPRVQDSETKADNVEEYILKETGKKSKEEFLGKENESANYFRNEYYFKKNEYKKHVDNYERKEVDDNQEIDDDHKDATPNVLSNEIENLLYITKNEKGFDSFELWYDDYAKEHEKKVSKSDKRKYEKNNNPFRRAYYLHSYYNFLFREQFGEKKKNDEIKPSDELTVFNKLIENKDKLENLGICDLELFPYRTESKPSDTLFKKGKSYKDLKSSQYVADLILRRILDEKDRKDKNDNLFFVFRSYKEWFKVIEYELARGLGLIKDDEELSYEKEISLLEIFDAEFWEYFYDFSAAQNGSLSQKNIEKAPKMGAVIKKDSYESMRKFFNLTSEKNSQNGK